MLALSEFNGYVSDSRRYTVNRMTPASRYAAATAQRLRAPEPLAGSPDPAVAAGLAMAWVSALARSPPMEREA